MLSAAERADDELSFSEQPADEPYLDEAQPVGVGQ